MPDVQGVCDERFGAVREALAETLAKDDVGASAAVFVDGEPVADIWGGYADAARTIGWERDTITNTWSTTKAMVSLCALILADRGDLDLAVPVARYWPEFAAAGKEGVLVRHLLAHTAGLPEFDGPVSVEDLYDWPAITARLAAQPPRWEPGTLACGGTARGVRLLSPAGCEAARREQYHGPDQVLGSTMRYGMGYGIFDRSIGWGGWGGSLMIVDMNVRMTVAYVMNQMLDQRPGDYRGLGVVVAAYESL